MLSLETIIQDFAAGFVAADARRPIYKTFKPGLGPHHEDEAVRLSLNEMKQVHLARYESAVQQGGYPNSSERCDLLIGRPLEWALEVKMARFFYDKLPLTQDPASIKDVLSPFEAHRSAVTDVMKLARSPIAPHKAVLIYGFDYPVMPLLLAIEAFELLARARVRLGVRVEAPLPGLVHPVHNTGAVFGWEVLALH